MAIKIDKKYLKVLKGLGFTALILLVWRIAYHIQIPMLFNIGASESLFGFLDVFSGGALSQYSIVALGVSPYITSSIVVQLLQMDIVPALKEWSEEGETGRKKINTVVKYGALLLAFIQALTVTVGIIIYYGDIFEVGVTPNLFIYVYLALIMTAGTAFTLWMAEKITLHGIGNGTSMFIVAGIVASFPKMINDLIARFITSGSTSGWEVVKFYIVLLIMILIIMVIVYMEGAQRKIPIQYANRPSSASFRGKNDSNIPIKLNTANVIPVIFASTLMSIPATILRFVDSNNGFTYWLGETFDYTSPIGYVLYIVLIILFAFFYAYVQLKPDRVAENLQNQNAYIPGVKPGVETSNYVARVLFKITVIGALYLALVASLPIWMSKIFDLPHSVTVGGTSLIIVVGVATETFKQIRQSLQADEYKGFLD